jgi:hypothetical protein
MMDEAALPPRWSAPLPNLVEPAIRQRLRVGEYEFRIAISDIQRDPPGEPDTDLIHLAITVNGILLTAMDLGLGEPGACANAWGFLTNRLTETVVQFYQPRPTESGDLNPRLGCWGARPDLVERGFGESDCAIAVVLGISVWTPGASPLPNDGVFLEALRDTLLEVLSYWVLVSRKAEPPRDRLN